MSVSELIKKLNKCDLISVGTIVSNRIEGCGGGSLCKYNK